MRDEVEMGISNSCNDLPEEAPGLFLADIVILDIIVKFSAVS